MAASGRREVVRPRCPSARRGSGWAGPGDARHKRRRRASGRGRPGGSESRPTLCRHRGPRSRSRTRRGRSARGVGTRRRSGALPGPGPVRNERGSPPNNGTHPDPRPAALPQPRLLGSPSPPPSSSSSSSSF